MFLVESSVAVVAWNWKRLFHAEDSACSLFVCLFVFSSSEEIVVSQVILRGSNQQKQHVIVQV